jgi:ribonuclease BN (tRNA processing enzyme)
MSFTLDVLGSAGSGPTRTSPASGYLVRSDTTAIWVDAGSGTFHQLARRIDPADVAATVISHLHADHCADLFGWFHYLAYRLQLDHAIPVLLPPGGRERIETFLGQSGPTDPLHTVLHLSDVLDGEKVEVGDITVRFAYADHSVPAIAARFEHDGRVLVFSGDTGPGGGFAALADGADVVLCEAGLAGPRETAIYPFHLSPAEAGAIAATAGASTLVLTHLSPGLEPEQAVPAAATTFPGEVIAAEPGLVVEVGGS